MSQTIVLLDDRFLDHRTRDGHPESPERLAAIYAAIAADRENLRYDEVTPREATVNEIALNHSTEYIRSIEQTAGRAYVSLDPDTHTSAGTWEAARLAVGAVLSGIDLIMNHSGKRAFALVRPPGHHAEHSRAMGFCIFNNIAVGAQYLRSAHRLERILIFDWDLHHGNGTQHAFYSSADVLYLSVHQYPYYPGTGSLDETGQGQGAGYTVNIPLSGGQGDQDYAYIMEQIVAPAAVLFKPQFILVSAGYDIYHRDPLGTMQVTPHGFYSMAQTLVRLADELCDGRILFALEGGYHAEGIAQSVKYTLRALASASVDTIQAAEPGPRQRSIFEHTREIVNRVKKIHAKTGLLHS